jgi:hypothetical protein
MKLVKLTDTQGVAVYVNPEFVLMLGGTRVNGVVAVNQAAVVLNGGLQVTVEGSPGDIQTKLENPDSSVLV